MLIIFFGYEGVVHHEFVPEGQTVNKVFVLFGILKTLAKIDKEDKARVMEGKAMAAPPWQCSGALIVVSSGFSHKNGHYSHSTTTLLAGSSTFRLFPVPKLKSTLIERRFDTTEEIKENSLRDLKAIPKQAFQDCFKNCKKRW
jgi:hypothetical protein